MKRCRELLDDATEKVEATAQAHTAAVDALQSLKTELAPTNVAILRNALITGSRFECRYKHECQAYGLNAVVLSIWTKFQAVYPGPDNWEDAEWEQEPTPCWYDDGTEYWFSINKRVIDIVPDADLKAALKAQLVAWMASSSELQTILLKHLDPEVIVSDERCYKHEQHGWDDPFTMGFDEPGTKNITQVMFLLPSDLIQRHASTPFLEVDARDITIESLLDEEYNEHIDVSIESEDL